MSAAAQALFNRATAGPAPVRRRFGTARGLARLWLSQIARARGRYRRYESVRWGEVRRLVFVCSGNICRSPYAERRARASGFPAVSVAVRGESGHPADPAARRAAAALNVPLDDHRSAAIDDVTLQPGDLLVAMEPWQAQRVAARHGGDPALQITLLGLWTAPPRPHLHDPHTLCDGYFETCFRLIDSGVAAILARLGRR